MHFAPVAGNVGSQQIAAKFLSETELPRREPRLPRLLPWGQPIQGRLLKPRPQPELEHLCRASPAPEPPFALTRGPLQQHHSSVPPSAQPGCFTPSQAVLPRALSNHRPACRFLFLRVCFLDTHSDDFFNQHGWSLERQIVWSENQEFFFIFSLLNFRYLMLSKHK